MDESELSSVNFVPCVRWIRKGVAKRDPVKIELTKEELTDLVKTTCKKLNIGENNEDSAEEENVDDHAPNTSVEDEFDMVNYDNDEDSQLNIGDIAVYDNDDPYKIEEDEPDSDAEDDIIKPEDNLLIVGHVEGFASSLEVYVFNNFEDSLYVHHDILLPSIPLCIEWLNYDPENVNRAANLCAVGNMSPIIDIWDVDLVNCIEPLYKLGKKPSKKRGTSRVGHKDSVLDLSWNINLTHLLASGSVDRTVLIWDLENQTPKITLNAYADKVQTLEWHPVEPHLLLTGSCERKTKLFDCRTTGDYKSWAVEGEVERVLWNRYNPNEFFCSDGKGFIYCFDYREENFLWKVSAHSKEVTGLTLSSQCPGFLATASQDGNFKVWDIIGSQPELINEKNLKIGGVHCLDTAPDDPFLMASGGDKKSRNLFVFNAVDNTAVGARFRSRELVPEVKIEGTNPITSQTVHAVMKNDKKSRDNHLRVVKRRKEFKKQK